jgi:hypothetical protein
MVSTTKGNIVEEEAAAAVVVEVAEETSSFSMEDYDNDGDEAYVGAVAQDAEAVADMEEADRIAAADGPTTAMSGRNTSWPTRGYPSPRSISSCLGHGSPLSPRICTRIRFAQGFYVIYLAGVITNYLSLFVSLYLYY